MKLRIAAALALIAATSVHAQTPAAPAGTDYGTATPIDGNWTYTPVTGGSEASFVNATAQPQVTISCTRATRQVTIAKPATGAAPFLTVWTTAETRALPASYNPATGKLSATIAAFDPFLDAIAVSRGRFVLSVSGQSAVVVPSWAEAGRVVEDCRA